MPSKEDLEEGHDTLPSGSSNSANSNDIVTTPLSTNILSLEQEFSYVERLKIPGVTFQEVINIF